MIIELKARILWSATLRWCALTRMKQLFFAATLLYRWSCSFTAAEYHPNADNMGCALLVLISLAVRSPLLISFSHNTSLLWVSHQVIVSLFFFIFFSFYFHYFIFCWGRSLVIFHVIKIIMLRQQTKPESLVCRPLLLHRRSKLVWGFRVWEQQNVLSIPRKEANGHGCHKAVSL